MFLAVKDLFKYISSAENTSVEFAFSSSNMPALTTILNGIVHREILRESALACYVLLNM